MSIEPGSWKDAVAQDLQRLRDSHLYRKRTVVRPIDATHVEIDGRQYVNFASNNYLGLTHHPRLIAAGKRAMESDGTGSGAAGLITGYGPAHQAAEQAIARWKGTEASVLLPSGYQANLAAIQTASAIGRLRGGARFLVDKLCHASLIDAVRDSGESYRIFPHNHIKKLQRLLEEWPAKKTQTVVSESIFSMDGDAADLRAIAELKRKHNFMLLVDEAHASGVYGPDGNGLAAELGLQSEVDVTVLTLSKALGGVGGAVCGSELFCNALVNHGRAYVFSTSISPAAAAVAQAAIEVIREEPDRRARLRAKAHLVRLELIQSGFEIEATDSPIIPVILGEESEALAAAMALKEAGLLVVAVRPPTVARGTSRLRLAICSEHTDDEITRLVRAIRRLPQKRNRPPHNEKVVTVGEE